MITMNDVAREAGVSRPTVSSVLNGKHTSVRISKATQEHILATARKLGYRRNVLATAVKTGKTNIVAFIGRLEGEYTLYELKGINDALLKRNYILKIFGLHTGNGDEVEEAATKCVEQMVGGVICRALGRDQLAVVQRELQPRGIPVVLIDNSFSEEWCPRVISDDVSGMTEIVKYLSANGHERIGHLTSQEDNGFLVCRKEGFLRGMKNADLSVTERNFCHINQLLETLPEDYAAIDSFYQTFRPTAIVCASDPLAMKLLEWAYRREIRIPDQLSVTGFGGLNYTKFSSPKLTTVSQPFLVMGERTTQKILRLIEGEDAGPAEEFLPVELMIRDSTSKINRI